MEDMKEYIAPEMEITEFQMKDAMGIMGNSMTVDCHSQGTADIV